MSTPSNPVWRPLLACASRRTRGLLGAGAVLGVVGRLSVVASAFRIVHGDARGATIAGVVAAATWIVQRALTASARVRTECDLYRASARALIETDVLAVPVDDHHRVVFEANHAARHVLVGTLPTLAADVVATVAVAPLLASFFPARVLMLAVVGLACVLASLALIRRATTRAQKRVLEATDTVVKGMLVAIEGRLELVARGGEAAFMRAYETSLAHYMHVATRAGLGAALLGRVPLLVGALAVAAIVAVDGASRAALTTTILFETVLLVALMPSLLGIVFGVHDLVRTAPLVAPLVALLTAPRRPELARADGAAVPVPAAFHFDHVTFSYDADHKPVLKGLDAIWNLGEPLVLVGPNGGGKSTALRLLMGLRPPTGGTVRLGSCDLATVDLASLRQRVAYLPQRPYLGEPYDSVRTAMHLGRPDASDASISASLARCGLRAALAERESSLGDPLDIKLGELSAGQKQRVALARILMQDASIVILDEPDANLDREGIELVVRLVGELARDGKMVAIAAHAAEMIDLPSACVVRLTRELKAP